MARKVELFGFEIGRVARGTDGKGAGRNKTEAARGGRTERARKTAKGRGSDGGRRSRKDGDGDSGRAGPSAEGSGWGRAARSAASGTSGSGSATSGTKAGSKASKASKATKRPASGKAGKSAKAGKSGASRGSKGPAASGKRAGSGAGSADAGSSAGDAPGISAVVRVLVMLLAFAAMVGFAVVLAQLTLVPSPPSVRLTHSNLHPGDSIRTYIDQPAFRDTVKQLGGNIVLGVPFGLLLPVLFPKARGLLRVGAVTAGVMLLVELVQGALVTGRAFDIDDVILNTGGALIGYLLLGRRMGRAVHPRRTHWWHRFTKRPATD